MTYARRVKPSALFLDCYGTLVAGDRKVIDRVVRTAARRSGIEPALLDRVWLERFQLLCAQRSGASFGSQRDLEVEAMREALTDCGASAPLPEIVAFLEPLFHYWRTAEPFADAIALLRSWTGCPVAILSNIDRADLDQVLTGLPTVAQVITSEDARAYKPDPAFFRYALATTGSAAEQVVHVGDSWESDVRGAAGVGIVTVWLDRAADQPPESDLGNQPRISSLAQLPERIATLPTPTRPSEHPTN